MARSPLSALSSLTVPLHLNILGWGVVAFAVYVVSPSIYEGTLVVWVAGAFALLYTVVAVTLLVVRIGVPELAADVPGASGQAVAMALIGAGLLLFIAYQTGGPAGQILVLVAPVVGLLGGLFALRSLRRSSRAE